MPERKYAMTKIDAGDYLLPANDGETLWRLKTYTEGPSSGLDWPRDREVWGLWKWRPSAVARVHGRVDPDDWEDWEFWEGLCETRQEAIDAALKAGS